MGDPAVEPFEGYDQLNVGDITDRLAKASVDEVAAIKAYEAANKDRSGVTGWEPPADDGPGVAVAHASEGSDPVGAEGRATYDPDAENEVEPWDPPEGRPPLGELAEDTGAAYAEASVKPEEA